MANKMKPSSLNKITDYKNLSGNEFFPVYLTGENFSITLDVLKKYIGVSGGGTAYVDFTSIDSNVIPDTDNTRILGNTNKSWKSLTLGDTLFFKKGDEVVSLQFGTSATLRVNGSLEIDGGLTIGEYSLSSLLDDKQNRISDLNTIRSNSQLGAEANSWGNHSEAGYATTGFVNQKVASKQNKLTAGNGVVINNNNNISLRLGTAEESVFDPQKGTSLVEVYGGGLEFNDKGELRVKVGNGLAISKEGYLVNTREAGKDVDLSGYYTKSETDSKVDALESKFQGQIDGLWSRNSFEELILGHAAADTIAVGEMTVDKINGGTPVTSAVLGSHLGYINGALDVLDYVSMADVNKQVSDVKSWVGTNYATGASVVTLEGRMTSFEENYVHNDYFKSYTDRIEQNEKDIAGLESKYNGFNQEFVDVIVDLEERKANKSYVESNFVTNDRASSFAEYGQFLNIGDDKQTITINDISVKPLYSHQTLYSLTLKDSAGNQIFDYDPKTEISGGYVYQLTKSMVGLGNVENTALSSWKGSTNITTLGTITSGTWNGSKIGQSYLDLSGYYKSGDLSGVGSITRSFEYAVDSDITGNLKFKRNDSTWSILSSSGSYYLTVAASNGNVGIGTTNPQAKLHVNGSARFDGVININGKDIAYSNGVDTAYFGNENLPAFISGTSVNLRYGTTIGMVLNSSGNVTIGDSDLAGSSNKLYVNGNTKINGRLHITENGGIPAVLQSSQGSTALGFSQKDEGIAYLTYSGGETWRVTNNNWSREYIIIHSGNFENYAPHKDVFQALYDDVQSYQNQMLKLSTKVDLLEDWVTDLEADYFESKDELQGQINSLWARNSFDELYATHVMSDTLAVEEMFTDKLTIGNAPIEYVVHEGLKLSTAIYIDGSSVALSNQLPTTTQKNNWNEAHGWGNHASAGYTKLKSKDGYTFLSVTGGVESEAGWALRIGTDFFLSSVQSAVYADYYSGSVYLGTPNYRWLSVYALSYDQSSDATLKDVLGDTSLTLSQIANAPAVSFTWKYNGKKDVGTLAQYWKDVLPEIVSGEEGNMGMNYAALGVVSSIILARNIETHEQRIERLERENEELRKEILTLKNR